MNRAAMEYAQYLLENEEDETKVVEFCQQELVVGEIKALVGLSQVEEDDANNEEIINAEFMDAHGLLLELQEELKCLINKDYTHIGVGFASSKGKIKVVELLT